MQYGNHGLQKTQKTNKKNYYPQHTATCNRKSSALYVPDESYIIFDILTTNVATLKPNIKINKLTMSSFDIKK